MYISFHQSMNKMERREILFFTALLLVLKDSLGNCIFGDTDILKDRYKIDTDGWTVVQVGTPITCPGYIKAWKWFPSKSASFLGLVWRLTNSSTKEYEVIGRTILPAVAETNKIHSYNLPRSDWIPVQVGDIIGFKFDQSLIRFDVNESSLVELAVIATEDLVIGSRHRLTAYTGLRTYSFMGIHEEYADSRAVFETKCKRFSTMKKIEPGGILQSHVIKSFRRPSAMSCVVPCQRDPQCMSLSYEKENQTCHLNDVIKKETNGFTIADNVSYYEFTHEHYEACKAGTIYNGDTRVCKCVGDNGCLPEEWTLVFKGVAGTGNPIYTAFVDGEGTSDSDSAMFLDSQQNFRLNHHFDDWSSLNITQVKLTFLSEFADELISLVFDGVDSDITSWYSAINLKISPWKDITSNTTFNFFSIAGHR
ncbi:uncharacterized protein LOC117110478 [Anneissia japonica]|uniref:uncharacterized protein LOC117110478 n=1 Tax=Anneissia japonica TaxID=1529436 RepID=UPI001425874F|nr:uncharacterized protein LOC117110478 [Anneissia japonica]